jgi:hypothetical protein
VQPRDLNPDLADRAARPEHEYMLAGLQAPAPRQRHPRGDRRKPERGDEIIADRIRQRQDGALSATAYSAIVPSPGAIPALPLNQTR